MSLFFWRKNSVIDTFATQLADECFSSLPPDLIVNAAAGGPGGKQGKSARKVEKKIKTVIDGAVGQIKPFIEEQRLGIYGRARLHMQFSERLQELGYSREMAKKLNENIMLQLPGRS